MKQYRRSTMTLIAWVITFMAMIGAVVTWPNLVEAPVWRYHVILMAFLLVGPLANALIQNAFVVWRKRSSQFFFSAAFKEKPIYEIVISLSAIILLPMVPGITLISGVTLDQIILYMGIWMLVAAVTTAVSYQTTKVQFYSDMLFVTGLNFFKSAGMSQRVMTALGIYDYNEFIEYTVSGQTISLILVDHQGQVTFEIPQDKIGAVASFLTAKGIERV